MGAFFHEWRSTSIKTIEHFYISIIALLIAIVVAVPIGILLSKTTRTANVVLTIAGASNDSYARSVSYYDSDFGVGKTPAIVALFIYVLLPILNNTVLGVKNIDKTSFKQVKVWE